MTDNTFHLLSIFVVCILLALLVVSIAFAVHYRRKYLKAIKDNGAKGWKENLQSSVLDEVRLLVAERDDLLDCLRQKAKAGEQITNDDMHRIETLEKAFRNDGMDHAVLMHRRTSRVSIAQAYLHLWGLADHEIAALFKTTRQSVHNNRNRLLKES